MKKEIANPAFSEYEEQLTEYKTTKAKLAPPEFCLCEDPNNNLPYFLSVLKPDPLRYIQ